MNTKQEAVQIDFYYENDVTEKDLKNIVKKVQTFCKNADYVTTSAFFTSRYQIQVIITFVDSDHKLYDNVRYALNRLIDSHKQPATYGWSLNVSDLLVKKVSA